MHTLDSLYAQAAEVGECLEWQGSFGCGRRNRAVPIIKGHRNQLVVCREVWRAAHGEIPPGRIIYRHCCNPRCIKLEHLRCGVQGDHLKLRGKRGLCSHLPSTKAAIKLSSWKRDTTKYSIEQARAVRDLAAAGMPDAEISAATEVGLAMVGEIRRGRAWVEHQPGASVFSWRPE